MTAETPADWKTRCMGCTFAVKLLRLCQRLHQHWKLARDQWLTATAQRDDARASLAANETCRRMQAQGFEAERNMLRDQLTECRRNRIGDSEIIGRWKCQAEAAEKSRDGWKHEAEWRQHDLDRMKTEFAAIRAATTRDVWYWQGDKYDCPESLTCPVVMTADALRALLAKLAKTEDDLKAEILMSTRTVLDWLDHLRGRGWAVAVHNDYREDGEPKTFWLLTHKGGRWVRGEGPTDVFALSQCRTEVQRLEKAGLVKP